MTRTRVCLISPGHLSTNPRLVKEADALTEAGYEVTVVACDYLPWAHEADKGFVGRPWRAAPPVRFGPHAPRATRLIRTARLRLARGLFAAGLRGRAIERAACHPAAPGLAAAAARVAADLYIAHYVAALPAAAAAARRHRARYAFDAEDFHTGEFAESGDRSLIRTLISTIEAAFLRGAAYITSASPGIADAYAAAYGLSAPTVVLNAFPRAEAPDGPTPKGVSAIGPSVYWFSQTIGRNRGLETAVRAIALAKSRPHLFLRGMPSGGFAARLTALAAECGVSERLHVLEPAPPGEMIRLASAFDVGLVGETGHTQSRRIALTNKQFTYLLAGLPVLMTDIEAHRAFAAATPGATTLYAPDDAQSLADSLDFYLCSPANLATARATAYRLGHERFNWEIEKRVLLGCVDRLFYSRASDDGAPPPVRPQSIQLPPPSEANRAPRPGLRVCLVTPGHPSTNPRLVKDADALVGAGYEVRVIAASYLPWAREADAEFAGRPWRREPPIRFGPFTPPVTRFVQVMRNRWGRLRFWAGSRKPSVLLAACHQAGPDLARAAEAEPADLYVGHNLAALPAVARAARRWGVPYAFDAEDFHSAEIAPPRRDEPQRLLTRTIEQLYLPGCVYVTAESMGMAEAYAEVYSIPPPSRVLNVFPRALAAEGPTRSGSAAPGPSVYWFSQTIGPDRGLETAVRAIGLARARPHLYLRGLPMAGFARLLEALADECGAQGRLHLMAPAAPGEMGRIAAPYDIGLSAEPGHDLNNRLSLGNKLFTYLLAGLPIVASSVPAHVRFAGRLGEAIRLFAANDAHALADAIDAYLGDPDGLASARAAAFRLGQERFNWDIEQDAMLACVRGALAGPGRAAR